MKVFEDHGYVMNRNFLHYLLHKIKPEAQKWVNLTILGNVRKRFYNVNLLITGIIQLAHMGIWSGIAIIIVSVIGIVFSCK